MTENEGKNIVGSLPEEAKSLLQILARNKMIPPHVCPEKIGQSIKEPIILEDVRDYVRMEYLILDYLFSQAPFKILARTLNHVTGLIYDHIIIELTTADGNIHLDYFFDISSEINQNNL